MKKLIEIPDEIVKDLKHLAIEADMSLFAFITKILVDYVKRRKKGNH